MPYDLFKYAHIALGVLALAGYWGAGLTRKGSFLHRSAGKLFLLAMIGILASALPLTARIVAEGRFEFGLFLAYLLLITANACWTGWRAVRDKADWRRLVARPGWRAWIVACLLGGVGMIGLGVWSGDAVIAAFGGIGPLIAWDMRRFARRGPDAPNWWLRQHYQAMIGNGIAVHVAFLGIGLRQLWPLLLDWLPDLTLQAINLFVWLGPLTVAGLVLLWLNRRHRPHAKPALPAG
jgi:hypothetical protein